MNTLRFLKYFLLASISLESIIAISCKNIPSSSDTEAVKKKRRESIDKKRRGSIDALIDVFHEKSDIGVLESVLSAEKATRQNAQRLSDNKQDLEQRLEIKKIDEMLIDLPECNKGNFGGMGELLLQDSTRTPTKVPVSDATRIDLMNISMQSMVYKLSKENTKLLEKNIRPSEEKIKLLKEQIKLLEILKLAEDTEQLLKDKEALSKNKEQLLEILKLAEDTEQLLEDDNQDISLGVHKPSEGLLQLPLASDNDVTEDEAVEQSKEDNLKVTEADTAIPLEQAAIKETKKIIIPIVFPTNQQHKIINTVSYTLKLRLDLSETIAAVASGDEESHIQRGLWMRGMYGTNNQGRVNNINGYKGANKGATIGFDVEIENNIIGIAYSNVHSVFKFKNNKNNDKEIIDSHVISIYGQKELPKNFRVCQEACVSFKKKELQIVKFTTYLYFKNLHKGIL